MADGEAAAALPVNAPRPGDARPAAVPPGDAPMSLVEHLTELRRRVIRAVLAVVIGSAVGFWFGNDVVAVLKAPLPIDQPLVFTAIGDPFAIRLRIAVVVGVMTRPRRAGGAGSELRGRSGRVDGA